MECYVRGAMMRRPWNAVRHAPDGRGRSCGRRDRRSDMENRAVMAADLLIALLFAIRPDGSGLRQITRARGVVIDTSDAAEVELPGPFAYQ